MSNARYETPRLSRTARDVLYLLAIGWVCWTPVVQARSTCDLEIEEARRAYADGNFERALLFITDCLEERPSRAERVAVYTLQAQTYIALDDLPAARLSIRRLLGADARYVPPAGVPTAFTILVEQAQRESSAASVSSVSKSDEPLREAPATVAVVTAEEIERRGYTDIEQILHDLPGFDISRGSGEVYSSIYQRGFRSENNDRLLFVVDGVEQNDLWSNRAYISRQFPVANIARMEVVYGPASTIYGPNAYTGVISIVNKEPEAWIELGKSYGGRVDLVAGPSGTELFEAHVAGKTASGGVRWSLSSRRFRSDERNLSGFEDWNFDPNDFDLLDNDFYRRTLSVEGAAALDLLDDPNDPDDPGNLPSNCLPDAPAELDPCRNIYTVETLPDGSPRIVPTDVGIARAREADKMSARAGFDGPPRFENATDDWMVSGRVDLPNLTVGVQAWRRQERAIGWFQDLFRTAEPTGFVPEATAFYLRYFRDLSASTSLQIFSRYKKHVLDGGSSDTLMLAFANGERGIGDLLAPGFDPVLWSRLFLFQASEQLRNEVTYFYRPSTKLSLVAGFEHRTSAIQTDLLQSSQLRVGRRVFPAEPADPENDELARLVLAGETGSLQLHSVDVGVFTQLSLRPRKDLRLVLGGRYDRNDVRQTDETSSVFSSRVALVHTPGRWAIKAIFAEAFKIPSSFQRFNQRTGLVEGQVATLADERVENLELGVGWHRDEEIRVDLSLYESRYSDVVGLREVPGLAGTTTFRRENQGALRIRGAQLEVGWFRNDFELQGSYTYTEPFNVAPGASLRSDSDRVRIGDIARHRLTLAFHRDFLAERLGLNVRLRWVGERPTGEGTTVPTNPASVVDAYAVADLAVSFDEALAAIPGLRRSRLLRSTRLQLRLDNLFDTSYRHPGVGPAGRLFAASLPQPGRQVVFRFALAY